MDGLAALEGCEVFDIEELPELGPLEDFDAWLLEMNDDRASSPILLRQPHQLPMSPPGTPPPASSSPSTSPLPLMFCRHEGYYVVPADNVQWEAVAEEDLEVIEVEPEDDTTTDLIIVIDDDDEEDVQIVCEVTYRPHKRSRD